MQCTGQLLFVRLFYRFCSGKTWRIIVSLMICNAGIKIEKLSQKCPRLEFPLRLPLSICVCLNRYSTHPPFGTPPALENPPNLFLIKGKKKTSTFHPRSLYEVCSRFREKNQTTETISLTATFNLKPYLAPKSVATQYKQVS